MEEGLDGGSRQTGQPKRWVGLVVSGCRYSREALAEDPTQEKRRERKRERERERPENS